MTIRWPLSLIVLPVFVVIWTFGAAVGLVATVVAVIFGVPITLTKK